MELLKSKKAIVEQVIQVKRSLEEVFVDEALKKEIVDTKNSGVFV